MLLAGLMPLAGSAGDAGQSLESIREAARQHVSQDYRDASSSVVVRPGRLDSRLRLEPCEQPLHTFPASGSPRRGNTSIGVECPGRWKLYVPVRIEIPEKVVVLDRAIGRGEVLQVRDLATRLRDTQKLARGYFTEPERVIGQVMRRPATAGTVLTPPMLEAATLIQKGQRVQMEVSLEGIRITATGVAMTDAARGQRLPVRNLSSNKVVEGIATGPETVSIR